MTVEAIKKIIIEALKAGVNYDGKHYTMKSDRIEEETKYNIEELKTIYKLTNVKKIYTTIACISKDSEFNYIEYILKINLDFGHFTETTYNMFVAFKIEQ